MAELHLVQIGRTNGPTQYLPRLNLTIAGARGGFGPAQRPSPAPLSVQVCPPQHALHQSHHGPGAAKTFQAEGRQTILVGKVDRSILGGDIPPPPPLPSEGATT